MGTSYSVRSPRLTRQHFQLIAETINELAFPYDDGLSAGSGTCKRYVAEVFADALACTNPQFNSDRFVRVACGEAKS